MRWEKVRCISVPLLGFLLALALSGSPLASYMERAVYDHLLGLTTPAYGESQVAVIAVDNAALNRFPEPIALWHSHWATVLKEIARVDPRGIAMDMIFAISLESVAPELDERLMTALRETKTRGIPVYLGMATGPFAQLPHPKFAVFSSGLGFLNLSADDDSVVRRQQLIQTNSQGRELMALPRLLTDPALSPHVKDQTRTYIDYRYPPPPVFYFADVHQWATKKNLDKLTQAFKDKFILIGFQAPILQDLHVVPRPASPGKPHVLPGLMIHARIAQTLLGAKMLQDISFQWMIPACLFLWIISSSLFFKLGPLLAFIMMGGVLIAVGIALLLTFRVGIVLPAGPLICFSVAPGLTAGIHQFASEFRRRRILQNYFGRYVHPRVVEDILMEPKRVSFGGNAVVVTVMFTDIRNFTRLCETREPAEVLDGLNHYFEAMNEAIHAAGGYLNRTIGDGILALFGAPLPLPGDGAEAAVRCGLDMLHRLQKLNEEQLFPGADPVQIGIGIHTGQAIVGNVGSQRKIEYTIVGDTANVAARIENLTKTYNETLLASKESLSKIHKPVRARYLDTTAVKGRDQRISLYAVDGFLEKGKEE